MRIAHIITRLIVGGAQENTILTCQDLKQLHGDQVRLFTGPGLGPEGSLVDDARARGIDVAVLPNLRRAIHPWHDARAYLAIVRALREFRPDVVHTHSAKAGLLGRVAASAIHVPVVVHTVHGAPFHPYQGRGPRALFRWCERFAAARCDALVSVADAMTALLVEAGVAKADKFTTIYSGFDVEPFLHAAEHRQRMRAKLGYATEHVVVGKVARLYRLKGHDDLIAAASRAVGENPLLRFLLVGDGALRARLERQVRRANLEEYFQFVGRVAPGEIPPLVGAMDLVVHASLREGLARVLPQALIAGKPAVSYDVDGAREVVVTGQTGFLIPPRDVTALAAAIGRLAADPELRKQLGEQGRARYSDLFRHERMTGQLRELYARLLAAARSTT